MNDALRSALKKLRLSGLLEGLEDLPADPAGAVPPASADDVETMGGEG